MKDTNWSFLHDEFILSYKFIGEVLTMTSIKFKSRKKIILEWYIRVLREGGWKLFVENPFDIYIYG